MVARRVWIGTAALLFSGATACGGPPPAAVALDIPGRSSATPWVAAEGSFVAVAWGASADTGTDVFTATSSDGGVTFAPAVQVNRLPGEARLGGELPPRVALRPNPGSSWPDILVVWTARGDTTQIRMAWSTDGGRTFDPPVSLQSPGAAGDRGWSAAAIDSAGTPHVLWLDHRGLVTGGGTHGRERGHHDRATTLDGVALAQKSGLYYASASSPAERELAKGVCYCCKTALAAGRNGALYAAWRHVYPGNLRDIAFSRSIDGGRTFSSPVRVSEDGWAIAGCPDDGPAVSVDEGETVHVVWPTVIGGSTPEAALYYAATTDGQSFTPRVRVPTLGGLKPAHPQIAVADRQRIVVAWDESVRGQRVAAMREVRVHGESNGVAFSDAVQLGSDGPALYPVLAASGDAVVAVWTSGRNPSRVMARRIVLP